MPLLDAAQLTGAALSVMLPWLQQVGLKALDKLQGDAVTTAAGAPAKIFGWLKEKVAPHPGAAAALAELPAGPDDPANQQTFALQIEKLLKSDEALREELAKLLPEEAKAAAAAAGGVTQTINQTGSNNKATQIHGKGNTVTNG